MKSVSLIVAVSDNNIIGNQGSMPWDIPEDLKWFQQKTMNKAVIMGRDTYNSIPIPLQGRREIVITSNPEVVQPKMPLHRVDIAQSIHNAVQSTELPIVLIGGQRIYEEGIQFVNDKLYITFVRGEYEGDRKVYLPHYIIKPTVSEYRTSSNGFKYCHKVFSRRGDLK